MNTKGLRLRFVEHAVFPVMATGVIFFIDRVCDMASRESPKDAEAHEQSAGNPPVLSRLHREQLQRDGFVVIDDVISASVLKTISSDCEVLKQRGEFQKTDQHSATVRGDHITWLEDSTDNGQGLQVATRRLRSVAACIESGGGPTHESALHEWQGFANSMPRAWWHPHAQLGVPLQCQLASYGSMLQHKANAEGSPAVIPQYTAHRDTLIVSPCSLQYWLNTELRAREVTAILYLTDSERWQPDQAQSNREQGPDAEHGPTPKLNGDSDTVVHD